MGFNFFINMQLRPYQQNQLEQILFKLPTVNKLCVQLSTGGGKTVIFTELTKRLNDHTLILVDSEDLVTQTYKTFLRQGVDVATFESKNKIFPNNKVVVSMAQTLFNRLQKKTQLIERFNYLIIDEAHVWIFNKIFDYTKDCKIIGFTATPVRLKRNKYYKCNECNTELPFTKELEGQTHCGYDLKVWTKEETMSDVYDDVVVGVGIDYLIENDFLVDEELYSISVNTQNLKTDSSGEFTAESIAQTYEKEEVQIDILHNYEQLCLGKKTMIFTASTKVNLLIYEMFKEKGYNVRMYDSVNNDKKERKPLIRWFESERDAILLNVSCFTKGFDVDDVEAIIMARPTASLSLFIQIAGRGARPTKKIYKDKFIFIDGGGNSDRLGMWSDKTRDWEKIFFNGLKPPKQLKESLDDINECNNCGFLKMKSEKVCPNCNYEEPIIESEEKEVEIVTNKVTAIKVKQIYPSGEKIIKYVQSINEDINFAFKILINQTFDLFVKNRVTFGSYQKSIINGSFDKKINRILGEPFIKIINALPSRSNRTLAYLKSKLKEKLQQYYDKI
jgi:superfamily II DNA or RNA helicase